jgi:GDP-L-fucose synthase
MPDLPRDAPIFVSGHRGMVGSALVRRLEQAGFTRVLVATRDEVDLRDQAAVDRWFTAHRPRFVLHAAGTVGGIQANVTRPAEFMYDNLLIQATVLRASWQCGVEKLLYLGSSCVYPCDCPQPMREEHLLTGPLEPTNEPYALAKIAGVKSCIAYRRQYGCNFISALPTNLYGPHDHFELAHSHVLAALVRKFHDARISGAKTVVIWGSGAPRREFLHVDDLADACLLLLERYDEEATINVGCGADLTIADLANLVREAVYPAAELVYDTTKPDGVPRKLLDCSRLAALGWQPRIVLWEGIASTYRWFCDHLTACTA